MGGGGWWSGGVAVWSGQERCGDTVRVRVRLVSSRGQSDSVRIVVSCDPREWFVYVLLSVFFVCKFGRCL